MKLIQKLNHKSRLQVQYGSDTAENVRSEINFFLFRTLPAQLLLAFSARKNLRKLCELPKDPQATLTCMFGLRFGDFLFIILPESLKVSVKVISGWHTFNCFTNILQVRLSSCMFGFHYFSEGYTQETSIVKQSR